MTAPVDTPSAPTRASARSLGAYYTGSDAADWLVRWSIRGPGDRVLEPSMGDGAFLGALARESSRRSFDLEVTGVELDPAAFGSTVRRGLIDPADALQRDFLEVDPFPVEVVVGNPPYVRLRNLPERQAMTALDLSRQVLGRPMETSGSLWMPFVLHSRRFLVSGGRLALVLPHDLTYVRYARPLWTFLGSQFASLKVVRVHERMFPDIMQEVVLLLADGAGGSTDVVEFEAFRTLADLERGDACRGGRLTIEAIAAGRRVFIEALLSEDAQHLLDRRLKGMTVPARELVTFNIGYVCGDKGFFHPTPQVVEEFGIPQGHRVRSLTSSRRLRGSGLLTSAADDRAVQELYLPLGRTEGLSAADRAYIRFGEASGVDQRYKCRVRSPWYVTPGVRVPDVMVTVFSERPTMVVNDAGLVASNSMLCGYLTGGRADTLTAGWFTSLTLLQLELEVHALGGGVMVLVPLEAGNVRLPPLADVPAGHLDIIDKLLVAARVEDAFRVGDDAILRDQLGLGHPELTLVREAVDELAFWRSSARR